MSEPVFSWQEQMLGERKKHTSLLKIASLNLALIEALPHDQDAVSDVPHQADLSAAPILGGI